MRLYLVRHAAVTVRRELPAGAWHLSPEGRAAGEELAQASYWRDVACVYTSPEPKAAGTAQRIAARHGLPLRVEPDLRETEGAAWIEGGIDDAVRHYFAGEPIEGWEPAEQALERAKRCVDAIAARSVTEDVAAVSHGRLLTLYLKDALGFDAGAAFELWSGLRFPDVAAFDPVGRRMERSFGWMAGAKEPE